MGILKEYDFYAEDATQLSDDVSFEERVSEEPEIEEPAEYKAEVSDIMRTAKKYNNRVTGTLMYLYYLSPLGWLFHRNQHNWVVYLTKHHSELS